MNVLNDPLVTVRSSMGDERVALARLLARLLAGPEIDGFPRLAGEQRGYWWRFLARCGARAMRTASITPGNAESVEPAELEARLREALLQHSTSGDWELYQPDHSRAGFLQPPTPSGKPPPQDKYGLNSSALLTALIGTKEHERKSEIGRVLNPESAVYALVEYQGGVIFGGRGNYESQLTGSRSGAGSGTPFVGAWIGRSQTKTFRHDVGVMLDRWNEIASDLRGDVWALWTHQWNGDTPIPAARLDPAFIPLARMVRLGQPREGRFDSVWFRASNGSRVDDHTQGGRLGDPFTPLIPDPKHKHLKVRGALEKGYDYKEVVRLLFPRDADDAVRSASVDTAFRRPPHGEDLRVIFEGTAFEQGKTRGFHRRVVRLPQKGIRVGVLEIRTEPIHAAHTAMLDYTAKGKRVLRAALAIVLTGESRARDDDRKKMAAAQDRVEEIVDREYLDFLFEAASAETGESNVTEPYRQWLFGRITEDIFPEALGALPRSQGRRFEKEVSAEAYLRGRLRRELDLSNPEPRQEEAA